MFKIIKKEILSSLSVIKARIFFIFILSLIVTFLELINLGLIIPIINKFVGGDDFINYEFFNFINELLSAVELAVAFVFIIFVKFIFTSFNLFFVTKTGFIIREYWTNSLLKKF